MMIEVCAGSLTDCLTAQELGASRIELNSALHLGGLTPSLATVILAKQKVFPPIICMVRPRGGGFCYSDLEKDEMFLAAKQFLEAGVKGIAFGFLQSDGTIDQVATKRMIKLCNDYQAESVFHRAIDCTTNYQESIAQLVNLGATRILTSGGKANVRQGVDNLRHIQKDYGNQIELCIGCGITPENVCELIEATTIRQIHGSFKEWQTDPTTSNQYVSYRYSEQGDYDAVGSHKLAKAINNIRGNTNG
ncbi:copper homeostasis protein [Granulicatella balaenopterae]|uniref:PF03932 family protein CutC n=1 Tax=Granulicatella balaenopterae TaxID=137733 RepID=A0A1H9K621_9LACT|nr:copper homeostasis protein CutC [Granulicatella balaenopterae]SEQ94601.1 copper homeostasis protein [Granulicatella balaenopterae]